MELDKNKIIRYEELKLAIKLAEEELATLQPEVVQMIASDQEVQCNHGKLYIQERFVWTYSEDVSSLDKKLKDLRKEEQAKGIATSEAIPTLYYKLNKE